MNYKCMDCHAVFIMHDDHCCPVCGSPDVVEDMDDFTEFPDHFEGDFQSDLSGRDDREE